MKGLNLKHFRKTKSDDKYVTMQHYAGHEIRIAKNKLSKQMRDDLESLPTHMAKGGMIEKPSVKPSKEKPMKMADGGEVPDPRVTESQAVQMMQSNPNMSLGDAYAKIATQSAPQPQGEQIPPGKSFADVRAEQEAAASQPTPQSAPQPQAAPQTAPMAAPADLKLPPNADQMAQPSPQAAVVNAQDDAMNMLRSGISHQVQGIQGEAQAQKLQSQEELNAIASHQKAYDDVIKTYNTDKSKLDTERANVVKDLQDGKIDPNRFMNNMGTGQKIASAIGLLMSGIGSGLTHQENMAGKFLDDQITRDIDAQKANIHKSGTLLNVLQQQYGNLKDATDMARVHMNDALAMQLKAAAAKAASPMAAARAMQLSGQIEEKSSQIVGQMGARRTMATLEQRLAGDPSQAQSVINAVRQLDPERGKDMMSRYVPGLGLANTQEQQKELNKSVSEGKLVTHDTNRLLQILDTPGKSLSPELRAEASSLAGNLMGPLRESYGMKTLTEGDQRLLEKVIGDPTKLFSLDIATRKRLEVIKDHVKNDITAKAEQAGLKYDPVKMLSPQEQGYAQWAKQNPHDPRAALVLKKLGL